MSDRITALMVDDEKGGREVLRNLIGKFCPEIRIVGEAENVEAAFQQINEKKPQLVFLDIQMPRASGFSLLKQFDPVPFEVIFVTSFDQYAINAIKFSALDYLLKPVEIEDLQQAIKKAVRSIEMKTSSNPQFINLLHNLETDLHDRKIAVHIGENVRLLSEFQIAYIEGDGRYCNISMDNGDSYTTARYLKDFEDYLGQGSSFVRISKSYLLNAKHIRQYSKGEPCIIEMQNGKVFEVSRRKKQEVMEKLRNR